MSERFYELVADASELGDTQWDVDMFAPPAFSTLRFFEPATICLPLPVVFAANFTRIATVDLPCAHPFDVPVVSRRLLDVLLSVAPFAHEATPVVMVDDVQLAIVAYQVAGAQGRTMPSPDDTKTATRSFFDAEGIPVPTITDSRFVILHLTEHSDAFDWERSEHVPSNFAIGPAGRIEKLVLKDVPLPPIFRLAASPADLYVSAEARAALERAGIRGPLYLPA